MEWRLHFNKWTNLLGLLQGSLRTNIRIIWLFWVSCSVSFHTGGRGGQKESRGGRNGTAEPQGQRRGLDHHHQQVYHREWPPISLQRCTQRCFYLSEQFWNMNILTNRMTCPSWWKTHLIHKYTLSVQNTLIFPWHRLTRWIQVKGMIPYWCHLLNPLQSV